jgi:hypothetical protein
MVCLALLQVPEGDIEPVTDLPSLAGMASPNGETQVRAGCGHKKVVIKVFVYAAVCACQQVPGLWLQGACCGQNVRAAAAAALPVSSNMSSLTGMVSPNGQMLV